MTREDYFSPRRRGQSTEGPLELRVTDTMQRATSARRLAPAEVVRTFSTMRSIGKSEWFGELVHPTLRLPVPHTTSSVMCSWSEVLEADCMSTVILIPKRCGRPGSIPGAEFVSRRAPL